MREVFKEKGELDFDSILSMFKSAGLASYGLTITEIYNSYLERDVEERELDFYDDNYTKHANLHFWRAVNGRPLLSYTLYDVEENKEMLVSCSSIEPNPFFELVANPCKSEDRMLDVVNEVKTFIDGKRSWWQQ
jgi:hypothetical protein